MPTKLSLAAVAALILIPGCVSSEQALVTPEDEKAIFDPALLGDWSAEVTINAQGSLGFDNGSIQVGPPTITQVLPARPGRAGQSIRFERLKEGSKGYLITERSTGDEKPDAAAKKPCAATILAIGEARFLDVLLVAPEDRRERRHQFFKVEIGRDTLAINAMNSGYFSAHPEGLAHFQEAEASWFSSSTEVITAPTPTLQAFVAQHRDDPDLWPKSWRIELHRP